MPFIRVAILCFVLSVTFGCATTESTTLTSAQKEAVSAEIGTYLERYRDAYASGEADAIRSLYVSDDRFAIYEDGMLRYPTVDEILEGLKSLPEGSKITTSYSDPQVSPLREDLGWVVVHYETNMDMGPNGAFSFSGVMTLLVERTTQGWKTVTAHGSSKRQR